MTSYRRLWRRQRGLAAHRHQLATSYLGSQQAPSRSVGIAGMTSLTTTATRGIEQRTVTYV